MELLPPSVFSPGAIDFPVVLCWLRLGVEHPVIGLVLYQYGNAQGDGYKGAFVRGAGFKQAHTNIGVRR